MAAAGYSWAGWWHALVSAPVALVLLMGWYGGILIWGLFLFRVSRIDLQRIPTHPDLVGGLQFVGLSLRAFLLLSFTISMIAAGGVAHRVLYMETSFFAFKYVIAAVVSHQSAVVRRACRWCSVTNSSRRGAGE